MTLRVDPISLTALILIAVLIYFGTVKHLRDTTPPDPPTGLTVSSLQSLDQGVDAANPTTRDLVRVPADTVCE